MTDCLPTIPSLSEGAGNGTVSVFAQAQGSWTLPTLILHLAVMWTHPKGPGAPQPLTVTPTPPAPPCPWEAFGLNPALQTPLLAAGSPNFWPIVHGHLLPHIAQQLDMSPSSCAGKHPPQLPPLPFPAIQCQDVLHSKAEETRAASEDTT